MLHFDKHSRLNLGLVNPVLKQHRLLLNQDFWFHAPALGKWALKSCNLGENGKVIKEQYAKYIWYTEDKTFSYYFTEMQEFHEIPALKGVRSA